MSNNYVAKQQQWGEQKVKTNLTLTPTVKNKLSIISNQLNLSKSEVIERLVRQQKLNDINSLLEIKGVK